MKRVETKDYKVIPADEYLQNRALREYAKLFWEQARNEKSFFKQLEEAYNKNISQERELSE